MISNETIVQRVNALPTLSAAFAKLADLVNDEDAGAADFEAVLKMDPALTANLLKTANSARFGLRREVTSVRHAVALMGARRVFELAASLALAGVIPATIPGYGIPAKAFWAHSAAVAVLSDRLALELDVKASGMIFTAGLLHDIGKLVIGSFLDEGSTEILDEVRNNGVSFFAAEESVLGASHSGVGGAIAKNWSLPAAICSVVEWHHRPGEAPAHNELVDLIHIGDGLAHLMGYGADVGELARRIDRSAVERLGLSVSVLESVASDTFDKIAKLKEGF